MNRYEPSNFRPAFGVAAAALSAVTLALAVVLPVGLGGACEDATLASRTPDAINVAIEPSRIEVVAVPARRRARTGQRRGRRAGASHLTRRIPQRSALLPRRGPLEGPGRPCPSSKSDPNMPH